MFGFQSSCLQRRTGLCLVSSQVVYNGVLDCVWFPVKLFTTAYWIVFGFQSSCLQRRTGLCLVSSQVTYGNNSLFTFPKDKTMFTKWETLSRYDVVLSEM